MNSIASSRALLVDDDPAVLALLSRTVEGMGVRAESARSRSEARARLRAENFDMVISDVYMETYDAGIQLAKDAERPRPGNSAAGHS
jgi:CheY-like chemotaxis protein